MLIANWSSSTCVGQTSSTCVGQTSSTCVGQTSSTCVGQLSFMVSMVVECWSFLAVGAEK
jgi:hypothetical protein